MMEFVVEVMTPKGWEEFGGTFTNMQAALAFFLGLETEQGIRLTVRPVEPVEGAWRPVKATTQTREELIDEAWRDA